MKKLTLILLVSVFILNQGIAQNEKVNHFEIDAMVGMHHYSSSFFHAMNSVTWIQDPAGSITEFNGYGTSILPAFNLSYFFDKHIGITAGVAGISSENDLYVDDGTSTNYDYGADQVNINLGVSGRIIPSNSLFSINMGTGLIFAPFDISESIESSSGGSYLEGNNTGLGLYFNGAFQIKIFSFLHLKSQLSYSYIPTDITLYGGDGNIEQNINNLNIGGITLKTGFSAHF